MVSEVPRPEAHPSLRPQTAAVSTWMTVAAALPVSALVVALFYSTWYDLLSECWNNPAASQGLLIPPLAAYIAWLRRDLLTEFPARVEIAGLAGVAAGAMLLIAGRMGAEYFLTRVSFLVVFAGLIWTFQGLARLRALTLPLLLLATMIPLPSLIYSSLSGPLRLLASAAAEWIAEGAGVTLYREGNTLFLANIELGVEDACSGLTSLSSILIGALLLGYTICAKPWSRLTLVAAAVPVAILANVIRVAGTAILSDREPAYALGFYHAFSGWVVFVIAFTALYAIAALVRRYAE